MHNRGLKQYDQKVTPNRTLLCRAGSNSTEDKLVTFLSILARKWHRWRKNNKFVDLSSTAKQTFANRMYHLKACKLQ